MGPLPLGLVGAVLAAAILARPAPAAPLPPGRPPEFGGGRTPAPPPPPTATPGSPPAAVPSSDGCLALLRAGGVAAEPVQSPPAPDPHCAIDTPVRLLSVADPAEAGRTIAFADRPVVACRLGVAFAAWSARVAAPILRSGRGASLQAVRTGPGFECRGRNRQADAKLSAHGTGLAVDVMGFEFAGGHALTVAKEGAQVPPDPFFAAVRTAACGWFTTVLGPGSDPYHADHLHLDILQHGSSDRYRICQ